MRAERGRADRRDRAGWICANAGIDASNVPGRGPRDAAARGPGRLGPADPGRAARRGGSRPAVVIADSFGRPWRLGQTDVAIGCAGLVRVDDLARCGGDAPWDELTATAIAVADEVAAAADLVRAKDEGVPAASFAGSAASSPPTTDPARPPSGGRVRPRTCSAGEAPGGQLAPPIGSGWPSSVNSGGS